MKKTELYVKKTPTIKERIPIIISGAVLFIKGCKNFMFISLQISRIVPTIAANVGAMVSC
jgi:hypothetical protein